MNITNMVKDLSANKSFIDGNRLEGFLLVKAPDKKIEDAFLHDEEDNPVDCNIYHPKYGYKGFITTSREPVITSWNPIIYKDVETRNDVYCIGDFQLTCLHTNGLLTNKDKKTVHFVDFTLHSQTKLAANNTDFKEIYDRKFQAEKLPDNLEAHRLFKDELIKHIKELITLHRDNREFGSTMDLDLILRAEQLIEYVNNKNISLIINQKAETTIDQIDKSDSQTKKIITDALNVLDRKDGWRYAFANKEDFTTFLNLLTCFFEYKPFTIPQVVIKLKKNSKTKFAKALKPIHKELSEQPLKSDSNFFKILRMLNHFQDLTDDEIYSSITK